MADRLSALRRIAEVQAQMVMLAEWRLAAGDRQLAELGRDRTRLADYVSGSGALGVPLAQAALRSMHALDRRTAEVERGRAEAAAHLDGLRRRDQAVAARVEAAEGAARRVAETAELAEIMEAWLARRS